MAIETTYRTMLIEDFIKERLSQGDSVTAAELVELIEADLAEKDLTVPQFTVGGYTVARKEESSATKNNNAFLAMRQDLRVLYKNMIELTKTSIESVERWNLEGVELEKKLVDLEDRISNLLILTQDTEGYHSIIVENFSDTSRIDKDRTTAEINIGTQSVEIGPSSDSLARVFLNNLDPATDVNFKLRTTVNFLARSDQVGANVTNPFKQESSSWWTNISMKAPGVVTCELTVRLHPSELVSLNKVVLELHDSAEASPITITPLWSTDNITYNQVPSNTFVLEARSNAMFTFPAIEAKYFKFILTKKGPDQSSGRDSFNYQFGFKSIAFYQHSFEVDTTQYYISEPLFVLDRDGNATAFEKITLETCERVETDTDIDYYVTFSNDPDVPLAASSGIQEAARWFPITPRNRTDGTHPVVLDIGDINEIDIGDTESELVDDEVVKVSYLGTASNPIYVNPAQNFYLLSEDGVTGDVNQDLTIASAARYNFVNKNDRILNYQVKTTDYTGSGSGGALDLNENSLVVFRNIGAKGLESTDITTKVRDIQRGWGFEDPYYSCVIEVQNPDGMEIDVGDQPIIIDDVSYTNKVSSKILTGKTDVDTGIHRIKVHKSNWREITPELDSLTDLQSEDILYPYNHKLLIEGYEYGTSFPTVSGIVYTGADVFAENVMKRISPFDFFYNIEVDDYSRYAMDIDAPDTHTGGNDPTKVFLMKIDDSNPDFQNERFMIRFKQINLLQKYLRLRADLTTSHEETTPALQSYKIKLG